MKRSRVLAVLMLATLPFLTSSCGTSDKIASVSISAVNSSGTNSTGTINLAGLGGTMQLQVLVNYTSGKQIDKTSFATYTIVNQGFQWDGITPVPAPPLGATVSASGMVTAVDPGICTWVSTTDTLSTPGWAMNGWYQITAAYRGFSSQPLYVPVASAANGQANMEGECGPTTTGH